MHSLVHGCAMIIHLRDHFHVPLKSFVESCARLCKIMCVGSFEMFKIQVYSDDAPNAGSGSPVLSVVQSCSSMIEGTSF